MDKKQRKPLLKGVLSSLFLLTSVGWSEERFPNQINDSNTPLKLCSQAELKAFKLIHVGNAGLYLEDCKKVLDVFSLPSGCDSYTTPIFRQKPSEKLLLNTWKLIWEKSLINGKRLSITSIASIRMLRPAISMI